MFNRKSKATSFHNKEQRAEQTLSSPPRNQVPEPVTYRMEYDDFWDLYEDIIEAEYDFWCGLHPNMMNHLSTAPIEEIMENAYYSWSDLGLQREEPIREYVSIVLRESLFVLFQEDDTIPEEVKTYLDSGGIVRP